MTFGTWIGLVIGLMFFLIGFGAMGKWIPEGFYVFGVFGLLFTTIIFLIVGFNVKGQGRWRNFFLASLMAFGFSILYIYSDGSILAPIAILCMVLSAQKLASQPN